MGKGRQAVPITSVVWNGNGAENGWSRKWEHHNSTSKNDWITVPDTKAGLAGVVMSIPRSRSPV